MAAKKSRYIIDACALIDLKKNYPRSVFEGIWSGIERLMSAGILRSCNEVLKEISEGDDELTVWALKHKKMFKKPNKAQTAKVAEILSKYHALIDPNKDGAQADPFVIAVALESDPQRTLYGDPPCNVVISHEKRKGDKTTIPFVCDKYGVECIGLIDMFEREGWKLVVAGEKK